MSMSDQFHTEIKQSNCEMKWTSQWISTGNVHNHEKLNSFRFGYTVGLTNYNNSYRYIHHDQIIHQENTTNTEPETWSSIWLIKGQKRCVWSLTNKQLDVIDTEVRIRHPTEQQGDIQHITGIIWLSSVMDVDE